MTRRLNDGWTDERTEQLKALHKEGLSCSQMAARLGGTTRNAVIGKVYRLGLHREKPARLITTGITNRRREGGSPFGFKAPKAAKPPASTVANHLTLPIARGFASEPLPAQTEAPGSATILTLGAHMCKWPIGDPAADDFTLCGRASAGVYCAEHKRRSVDAAANARTLKAPQTVKSLRRYL